MINFNAEIIDKADWKMRYTSMEKKYHNLLEQFNGCVKNKHKLQQTVAQKDKEIKVLKNKLENIKKETLLEVIQMIEEGKFGLIEER